MKQNHRADLEGRGRIPRARKRKWRCSFCGFPCHGSRRGIMRCITQAMKVSATLGVPWDTIRQTARAIPLRYAVNTQRIVSIEHVMAEQIEHGQLSNDLRN